MDYTTLSLSQVQAGLADVARDAQETFGHLSPRQLNWRPDAARWSVAQCFDHLLTTNSMIISGARHALGDGRKTIWERMPMLPGICGKLLMRSQAPTIPRRFVAPRKARPSTGEIDSNVIGRFVEQHREAVGLGSDATRSRHGARNHDLPLRRRRHIQCAGWPASLHGSRPKTLRAGETCDVFSGVSECRLPMNKEEALALLEVVLAGFRKESHAELARRVSGDDIHFNRTGASGTVYQVEIQCFWEFRPDGDVRVMGSIDDGGWSAFSPLTRSFIKAPDDSFVGE